MLLQEQKKMINTEKRLPKRNKRRGIVLVAVLIIVAMLLPLITLVIASLNTEGINVQNQIVSSKVDQATQVALNEGIDLVQKSSQVPDWYTSNHQSSAAINNLAKTGVPRDKYGPSGFEGAGPDKVYGTDDDYWIGPRGDRSFKRGDDVTNPANYAKDFNFTLKHGPVYLGQQWSYNSQQNPLATNNTNYGAGNVAAGPPTFLNQYFPLAFDNNGYKGYDPRNATTFDRDTDGLIWQGRGYYPYADDASVFDYYRINNVSQIHAPGSALDPANLTVSQFLSYFMNNRARLHEPFTRDFKKDAPGLEGLKSYLSITDEAGRLNLNIFAKKIKVWAPENISTDYDLEGNFTNDFNQDSLTKVPGTNMPQMLWKWIDNPMFPDRFTEWKIEMDPKTLGVDKSKPIEPVDLDKNPKTIGNGEDIQHWYYVDTANRLGGNPNNAKDWAHFAFQSKRILMSLPGVDENLAENILLAMNPGTHTLTANLTVDGKSSVGPDNPRVDACNLTPWPGALVITYDSNGQVVSRKYDFDASAEDDMPLPMPRLFNETRELLDVKGMTIERYKRLQDLVTVHSYDTNYIGNYIQDIPQSADPINPPTDEKPVPVPDEARDKDLFTDTRYPIDKQLPNRTIDAYREEAKRMLAFMYNHLDITTYKKLTLPPVDRGGRVPGDPDYNTNTPSVPNPGNPALTGLGQFVSLNPQLTLDSFLSYLIYRNGLPSNLDFYYGDPSTAPGSGETPSWITLPGIPWPGTRDSFLPFWNAQPFNAPDPTMGRNVDATVKPHKIDSVADLLEVPLYRFDRMMVSAMASPPSALVCDGTPGQDVVKITYLISLSDILASDEPTVGGKNEYDYNPAAVIPGISDGYTVNAPYNVYVDVDNDGNFDRVWDMNNDGVPDLNPQLSLSSLAAIPAGSTDRRIPMQTIIGAKNKALFIAGMGMNANDNTLTVYQRLPNLVAYWKFCASPTPPDAFTFTAPKPNRNKAGSREASTGFAYDAYGNPYITSRIVVIKNEGTTMETRSDRLVKIFVQNNCDGYFPLRTNILATRIGTNTFTFQSSTAGGNNPTGMNPQVSDRKWYNWYYQKTSNYNDNPQPEDPNQVANPPYTTPIGQVNILDQVDPVDAGIAEGFDPDRDPDGCWPPAFVMTLSPNYGQNDPRDLPLLTINSPVVNREDEVTLIVSNYNPNGVGYPLAPPPGLEFAYDTVKLESLGAMSPLVGQVTCTTPSINQGERPRFKVSGYGGVPPYTFSLQIRQDNGAHTPVGSPFIISNSASTEEEIEVNLNLAPGNYWAELTITDSNNPPTTVNAGAAWNSGRPSPPDRNDPQKTFFMVTAGGSSGGKSLENVPSFNASFNVLPLSAPLKGFTVIPATTGGVGNYVYRWDVTTTNGDRVYSADGPTGGTVWYYHGLPKVNPRAYISFNRSETFYFDPSDKSDGIYLVRLSIIDRTNEDPSLYPAGGSSIATKVQKVVLYGNNASPFQEFPTAVLYANPPGNASSIGINSTVPTQPPDPALTPMLIAPADVGYPISTRMAPIGSTIIIYGRNFDPVGSNNIVTFGGNVVAKDVTNISSGKPAPLDRALRVVVPDGARSGYITVSRGTSQVSNQVFFMTNMVTAFDLVANMRTVSGGGNAPAEKWVANTPGTGVGEFPAISGVFQLKGGIPKDPTGLKITLNGTPLTYKAYPPGSGQYYCSSSGLVSIGGIPLKDGDIVLVQSYELLGDGSVAANNRPYRLELDYQGDGVWDEKLEYSKLPGNGDGARTSTGQVNLVHDYSEEGFGNYTAVLRVTDLLSNRIAVSKQLIQVTDPQNTVANPSARPKAFGLTAQIKPTFGDQYPAPGQNLSFEALVGGLQTYGKLSYVWTLEGAPGAKLSGTIGTTNKVSFPFEHVAQSRALSLKVQAQIDDASAGGTGVPTIFFISDGLDGVSFGNYEICAMNADGSNRRRITKTSENETWLDARDPGVGTPLLTFTRNVGGWSKIFTINPDGTDEKMISPPGNFHDRYPRFRNSNAGNYIVFSSNQAGGQYSIYRMDPNGGGRLPITTNPAHPGVDHLYPDYSGISQVVFIARNSSNMDNTQLMVRNDDGTGPITALAQSNDGRDEEYTYVNPSRTHVYYYRRNGSYPTPTFDIYRIDLASGTREQMTSDNTHGRGITADAITSVLYCSKPVGGEDIFSFTPAVVTPPATADYKNVLTDGGKYNQMFPCFTNIDTGPTSLTITSTDVFIIPGTIESGHGNPDPDPEPDPGSPKSEGWIYYSGTKVNTNPAALDRRIWRVKPDGTGKMEVTNPFIKIRPEDSCNDIQPDASLDGKTIVFARAFDLHPVQHWRYRVCVVEETSPGVFSTPVELGSFPSVAMNYMNPAISPDGRFIAISRHQAGMTTNSVLHLFMRTGATWTQMGDVDNSGKSGSRDVPAFSPHIASDGSYLITWINKDDDIMMRRINPDGTYATPPVNVSSTLPAPYSTHNYRTPKFLYKNKTRLIALNISAGNQLGYIDFNPVTLTGTAYSPGPPYTMEPNAEELSVSPYDNEFVVPNNDTGTYCQYILKVDATTGAGVATVAPIPSVPTERNVDSPCWAPVILGSGGTGAYYGGNVFYSGTVNDATTTTNISGIGNVYNDRRIWRAKYNGTVWTQQQITGLAPDVGFADINPRATSDGKTLVFSRALDIPGYNRRYRVMYSKEVSGTFSTPTLLDTAVPNINLNYFNPAISDDGRIVITNEIDPPNPSRLYLYVSSGVGWSRKGVIAADGHPTIAKPDISHSSNPSYYLMVYVDNTNRLKMQRIEYNGSTPTKPVDVNFGQPFYDDDFKTPKFFYRRNKLLAINASKNTLWEIDYDPNTLKYIKHNEIPAGKFTDINLANEISLDWYNNDFAAPVFNTAGGYPLREIHRVALSSSGNTPGDILELIAPDTTVPARLNVDDPFWSAGYGTSVIPPQIDTIAQMSSNIVFDKPYAITNIPSAYEITVQAMGGQKSINDTDGSIIPTIRYYPDANVDGEMESSVAAGLNMTYLDWLRVISGKPTMQGRYYNPEDSFCANSFVEGWFRTLPDGAGKPISYDPGIFFQTKPFVAANGIYDGYFVAEEKTTDPQAARNSYLDQQFMLVGGTGTETPPAKGLFNADLHATPLIAGEDGSITFTAYTQGGTGKITYEWEVVRQGTNNVDLVLFGSPRSVGSSTYTFIPSNPMCPDGTPMGADASSNSNPAPYSDTYIVRCRVRDNDGTGIPIIIRRAVVITPLPLSAQLFCVPPVSNVNTNVSMVIRIEGGVPPYNVTINYGDKTSETFTVKVDDLNFLFKSIVKFHKYNQTGDYVVSIKVTDAQPKTVQDPNPVPIGDSNYSQKVFIGDDLPMRVSAVATPSSGMGIFRTMVNYVVSGGTRSDVGGYEVACILYDSKGAVVKSNGMDQIVVRNSSSTFGIDSLPNTPDDWHPIMGLIPTLPKYLLLPPNNTAPFIIPEEIQNFMDQYHPIFLTVPGPGNYVLQVIARDARGEIAIDELNITSTGYIAPFNYNGLGAPRVKRAPDGRPVHAFRVWFDPIYQYGGSGGTGSGVDLIEDNTRSNTANSYRLAKAEIGVLSQLFTVDPNPVSKGINVASDPTKQSLYGFDQSTLTSLNPKAAPDFYDTYTIGRININTASEDVLASLFMKIRKVRGYYNPGDAEYDPANPNKPAPERDEYLTPEEARDLARAVVKYRNAFYASNKPKMPDGDAKGTWNDWGENTGSIVDHLPVIGPYDGTNPMNNALDSLGYDARLPEPGENINTAYNNHRAQYYNLDVKQGGSGSPYYYQFYAPADVAVVRLQHSNESDEEYARYLNNVLINSYDNTGAAISSPPRDSYDTAYAGNERSRTGFDARYYLTYASGQTRTKARNKQGMIYTPTDVAYTWMPNAPFMDPYDLFNVIDHSELSSTSNAFFYSVDNPNTPWDDRYDNFELNGAGDIVPISASDQRSSTWRIYSGPSLFRYAEVFNKATQEYQVVCNYIDDIAKYITTRSYVYRISAMGAIPNVVTSDDDKLSPGTLSRNRKLTAIVDIGDMYVGRDVDTINNPFLGRARILWMQDEVNSGLGF